MGTARGEDHPTLKASTATTADDVYEQIKQMIVNLRLRPGEAVRERELQAALEVGRTPVREALGRLAFEGIVEVYPRRAIVVAKLGMNEIRQIFETRLVVETASASLAATRITDEEILRLATLGQELWSSRDANDARRFLEVDQYFHREIVRASRNKYLSESVERIITLNTWLWNIYNDSRHAERRDLFEHDSIIAAITAHEPSQAEEAMREHIICSRDQLISGLLWGAT